MNDMLAGFSVASGEQVMAQVPMFAIVSASRPWVEANFKETDLTHVRPGQVATVVLAGMGGPTMLAILAADGERTRGTRRFVLQPNFGHEGLRRGLGGLGLGLVDEQLVVERGRFYAILVAEPGGVGGELGDLEGLVGPHLLARGGPVLARYLEQELRRCGVEAAGLGSATPGRDPGRARALSRRRELLAEALVKTRRQGHPGPA